MKKGTRGTQRAPRHALARTWGCVAPGLAMGLPVEPCALDSMVDPRGSGRMWAETCARCRRLAQYLHRLAVYGQSGLGGVRIYV
jgi:hypothetical protein